MSSRETDCQPGVVPPAVRRRVCGWRAESAGR